MRKQSQRPDWVPDDLFPFESRYLDFDGSRIHYIDEGSGPTILFLHGNPTWSFLYRNIVLDLRDSFRCVAVDYPGFGLSAPSDGYEYTATAHSRAVEAFVTRLDLHDVTLMGQDWGGPIGLRVATRQHDRFAGFILGNTWAWPLNGIFHFELASRMAGSPIARFWIRNANAFVNMAIPLGTTTRIPPEVMRAYRGPFEHPEARRPTWELPKELLRSEPFMRALQSDLPRIAHLPALFVWGGHDFALRARVELPRLETLFPNHETVVLDQASHFFQEDAPMEAAGAIRAWMNVGAGGS